MNLGWYRVEVVLGFIERRKDLRVDHDYVRQINL